MATYDKPTPAEYPEGPKKEDLKSFDLEIQEDHKGNLHSQISAYVLLVSLLTMAVIYYLST